MKLHRFAPLYAIAVLSAPTPGLAADAEAGLAVVRTLGTVNGQALACSELGIAARARQLMLAHAPKTPRFGAAYEEATQQAFTAQTQAGTACASGTELTARINLLAVQLADTLPVAAR